MLLSFLSVFKGKQFCDFLFAFLNEKHFQTGIYFERKEFALRGANTFLLDLTPIERGGKNKNGRVASPESVPTCLKA